MSIIDFEASGRHRSSYPISVGITNGYKEYYALIRPMAHWQFWSAEPQKLHRIAREALVKQGSLSTVVAHRLNDLLSGQKVYCDAIAWDGFWARILFADNGLHPHFQLHDIASLFEADTQLEKFLHERTRLVSSAQYQLHCAIDDACIIRQALVVALEIDEVALNDFP
jgi:hypothetical protein